MAQENSITNENARKGNIVSFLYLIRLNNCLIAVVSVIIAMYLTGYDFDNFRVLWTSLSVFFLMAGGNIINDYYDIETDKINKPSRPLISYRYNLINIFYFSIALFISAVVTSVFITKAAFIISASAAVLLFLYSRYFKAMPLVGNIVVSVLSGFLFIFGAEAGGDISRGLFPAAFAFLITLGRELTKDIEDVEGDEIAGMKTLPIMIGKTKTFFAASAVFLVLIFLTFIPYLNGMYNRWYFLTVVFGVDIVLIVLLVIFYIFDDINTKRFVNNYIKYDMLIGLLAMIMGVK